MGCLAMVSSQHAARIVSKRTVARKPFAVILRRLVITMSSRWRSNRVLELLKLRAGFLRPHGTCLIMRRLMTVR
uniref:Uncharacterized protein n=1 Tax=Oryza brachyantha TaxID=4533 RepID=J3KZS8_ORYBR